MDRQETVTVVKQIFAICHQLEGKSLKLMTPEENRSLSRTFQVHIETLHKTDEVLQSGIMDVVEKNQLAVKVKNGWLIIYKSYL
jgi:hypothetical protein